MSGKPAARLGDSSSCPKTGHGNNPIASGSPDVFFDGLPAARAGDSTGCGSTLSSNLVPNVLINGKPAATLGSLGDHGSVVIGGTNNDRNGGSDGHLWWEPGGISEYMVPGGPCGTARRRRRPEADVRLEDWRKIGRGF